MAWDADGSIGYNVSTDVANGGPTTAVSELSPTDRSELNDEDLTVVRPDQITGPRYGFLGVIFPELREIDGIFVAKAPSAGTNPYRAVQTSPDTSNGVDGTWTQQIADIDDDHTSLTDYRTAIESTAVNAVRAVRVVKHSVSSNQTETYALHVYGTISAGETPDRLLWIDDATGLEFTASLDYGDVPRGSARDRGIRLKNNSASLTATTIQYTAEDLYLGSGNWYTFTTPGGAVFSATQQIASLGAGATTGLITARQVVPDAATLGLHAARAYTDVSSWS